MGKHEKANNIKPGSNVTKSAIIIYSSDFNIIKLLNVKILCQIKKM